MEVKVLKKTKKELEIALGERYTLGVLLRDYLVEDPRVEFVAFRVPGPESKETYFYLRVKEGEAEKILKEAIGKVKEDLASFAKSFEEALK